MQILTVIKSATSIIINKIVSNIKFSSFLINIIYSTILWDECKGLISPFLNYFPVAPGILLLKSGIVISTLVKGVEVV